MMKNKFLLAALGFLLFSSAFAGVRDIGNGGDAIVCRDPVTDKINKPVQVLDFFEAREVLKWNIDLGPEIPGSNGVDMAMRIVDRIVMRHPVTAMHYRQRIKDFFSDARIVDHIQLHTIADTNVLIMEDRKPGEPVNLKLRDNYLLVPQGCKMVQLAIRRDKATVADHKTFTINGDLWRVMSPTERAGLILHEVIYEDMLLSDEFSTVPFNHPEPDSRDVRYMNAFFARPDFFRDGYDDADYMTNIAEHGWFIEDLEMTSILQSLRASDGVQKGAPAQFAGAQDPVLQVGKRSFKALRGSEFKIYAPGVYESIVLAENTRIDLASGSFTAMAGTELEFKSDGTIRTARILGHAKFILPGAQKIEVRGNLDHGPTAEQDRTDFSLTEFPWRFVIDEGAPYSVGLIANEAGQLIRTDATFGWTVQCPSVKPTNYCVELYGNGVVQRLHLKVEPPPTFPLVVVDSNGHPVNLTELYAQALKSYQFGGGSAPRLPQVLGFDESGRAQCPYVDENKVCHWIQRLESQQNEHSR